MSALFLQMSVPALAAPQRPERIVSLNLCTDQLVLMLADPGAIAAVSRLALQPENSFMVKEARRMKTVRGDAEEVIALSPDLILTGEGPNASRPSQAFLERLGYPLVRLGMPKTFSAIAAQIQRVAALLGEVERGDDLIGRMSHTLRAVAAKRSQGRPRALLFQPNGFTAGEETLEHAILERAGYRNIAADMGLQGFGQISLEEVVRARPDVIVFSRFGEGEGSLAENLTRHPVLRSALPALRRIEVPSPLWACAGPMAAEAVRLLAEARP